MSLKFIGNFDILAEGKYLFEILAQLRDFGVGRMITKGEWLRKWPSESSYCVIRKVEPEMDRWLMRGKVWAHWVYRNAPLGVYCFAKELDRSDWHLVHRRDELALKSNRSRPFHLQLPATVPMPPLEGYLAQVRGEDSTKIPREIPTVPDVDEEFKMFPIAFDQPVNEESTSIYDQVDKGAYLDLYGKELPCKVEKWRQ